MNVNNVFHDTCLVNWLPPDDDGGTEITHYIVEEQNDRWDTNTCHLLVVTLYLHPATCHLPPATSTCHLPPVTCTPEKDKSNKIEQRKIT